jgi:aminoglycoside/choline kinase family phosphotransferase
VRIAQFLETIGVRAPKIFFHDEAAGLIWMEDLGQRDLWTYRPAAAGGNASWPERRAFYQSALEEIWRLHERGWAGLAKFKFTLQIEFNAALYRWEQSYFFENCLGRVFAGKVDASAVARVAADPFWKATAEKLAAWPRVLVHRDFQSQNIILHGDHAHLIDFQGMRPGLAHYDLVSLLYDPYAQLPAEERAALLDYYLALGSRGDLGRTRAEFDKTYALCALQRLMQALGAYGFLGLVKEKPEFLAHVPIALGSLREVAATIPQLEEFCALLATLPA